MRDTETRFQADEGKTSELCWDSLEPGCYTRLSLGVLDPRSSADLQENLTFGERIGATIHAGIFSRELEIRPTRDSFYFVLPHELHYLLF